MYESFFGLTERPFKTVPDPDYLLLTEGHSLALATLRYGLMARAPITVLTGEIGSGKTTLLRHLMREVPADLDVGLISNMQAGRGELLHWVLTALGMPIDRDASYVDQFRVLQDFLVARYAAGARVVLIVDEAQNLAPDTLEELRMLSNINADKDELLQIILVGQPQLRDMLERPDLVQFSQRISADFHIESLNAKEVGEYIDYRLDRAGAQWRIFHRDTLAMVHRATRGVPRLINILCDLTMVFGYAAESRMIDKPLLEEFLTGMKTRGLYAQFSPLDGTSNMMEQRL